MIGIIKSSLIERNVSFDARDLKINWSNDDFVD